MNIRGPGGRRPLFPLSRPARFVNPRGTVQSAPGAISYQTEAEGLGGTRCFLEPYHAPPPQCRPVRPGYDGEIRSEQVPNSALLFGINHPV